jgi:acetyl-CoA carboxylase / biotin carboxylase 1
VQTEVPGSPIFLMQYAASARHLEVQILADEYGNAISLFGRDCSIQRRHQKIIEEAPAIVAPREIFEEMERAAVRLAKMVNYVSAGTVEYLYKPETQMFYFLELNPRLQVEHPCTEVVSDVNLPSCQLQIAMGIPLHRIKDIRAFYKQDPWGSDPICFDNPNPKPQPKGHVIAARITSENPDEGFKPCPGTIQDLNFKSNRSVWGYFSVSASGGIHEYADSQFGHCFSWADTRDDARENLVLALKELIIRGDFRTTVEYLVKILESNNYMTNEIDTGWLDKLIANKVQSEKPDAILAVICTALHIAIQQISSSFLNFQMHVERGHTSTACVLSHIVDVVLIYEDYKYVVQVIKTGPTSYCLVMNDSIVETEVHRLVDNGLLVSLDGASYTSYMREDIAGYRTTIDNKTAVFEKVSDPSSLRAPSTGKLIGYTVEDGGHLFKDETFATMEVMKLVMELRVTESGCVHYMKRPGAVLDKGMEIAKLTLDDPTRVKAAPNYEDFFPKWGAADAAKAGRKPNQLFARALSELEQILEGYALPEPYLSQRLSENINNLMSCLRDPKLPLLELQEIMSQISGRLSPVLENAINAQITQYASNLTSVFSQFPSAELSMLLDRYAANLQKPSEKDLFYLTTQSITKLLQKYRHGLRGHMKDTVERLLKRYVSVE